jgi:hypothetical protein
MLERGYFCATAGAVDEATIKAYIESQKWDEDDVSCSTRPPKPSRCQSGNRPPGVSLQLSRRANNLSH